MAERARINRSILAPFIVTCVIGIIYHLDLFSHVAYAMERGKLRADAEHLQQIDAADVANLEQISHAFSVIAETVKPSVVYIESLAEDKAVSREIKKMFGENVQPTPSTGTGSGVILDRNGYIVTNNHLVADADTIFVMLADGRQYRATIIGTDAKSDLAVVKIDADRLHPARFGESDRVKVGHVVLAIGSPFRLGHSVSHGIVSALGRSDIAVDIDYQNWIQTDAPINPGNSGGPLINTRGEVIGINTAIATETGGHMGVGFAIPSNTVSFIASKLKRGEKFVRGYLGVSIEQVNPKIASAYGLPEDRGGVLISAVGRRTPAARAGLKAEDILLAIDDTKISALQRFQEEIAITEPQTEIDLTVWRTNREIHVSVKVGAQTDDFSTRGSPRDLDRWERRPSNDEREEEEDGIVTKTQEGRSRSRFRSLGFEAATVSPDLAKRFNVAEGIQSGALITRVEPTSEAYRARLKSGYVIVRANGRRISNVRQLEQALTKEAVAKGVRLGVKRGENDFSTVLRLR